MVDNRMSTDPMSLHSLESNSPPSGREIVEAAQEIVGDEEQDVSVLKLNAYSNTAVMRHAPYSSGRWPTAGRSCDPMGYEFLYACLCAHSTVFGGQLQTTLLFQIKD